MTVSNIGKPPPPPSDKIPSSQHDNTKDKKKNKDSKIKKRRYVDKDELENELENAAKKVKQMGDILRNLIKNQNKILEAKIRKNHEQIRTNTHDIEELYDYYEEVNEEVLTLKENNDDTSSDTSSDSDNDINDKSKLDLGKKLITIIASRAGRGSGNSDKPPEEDDELKSDISEIVKEVDVSKFKRDELELEAMLFASYCFKVNTKFNYKELKYFINATDEYRDNILVSLKDIIDKKYIADEPYSLRVMSSGMEAYIKQIVLNKVNQLRNVEPGQGDYYKLKKWVDTALGVPWGKYRSINVSKSEIPNYLTKSRSILDKVIYGQDESKDTIIQIISKLITNTNVGNVFSLYGPAGVGKTTIIKNGLAKALNLPFAFISLGGATDASYLDGHGYTYEGSIPGRIVDIITKAGCMNPIIYFDELDKVSNTAKGKEIMNLLVHLTDPIQSSMFQDKYLGSMDIDLSRCIFVFSFNDITKVSPILLDRMKLIYVNGFTNDEKRVISRNYLLPDLLNEYNLYYNTINSYLQNENNINEGNADSISEDTEHIMTSNMSEKKPILSLTDKNIDYIIKFSEHNGNHLDTKEEGVRQIKQRLEKLCSLVNIIKITNGKWAKPVHSILDKIPELCKIDKSEYPITLNNNTIGRLLEIKNLDDRNGKPPFGMYC